MKNDLKRRVLALILCCVTVLAAQGLVFAESGSGEAAAPVTETTGEDLPIPEEALNAAAPESGEDLLSFPGRRYYSYAFEVLKYTNEERAKNGLPALRMDADLLEGAMKRGQECVMMFSHYRPNDSWCFTVCDKAKAENIAMGQTSAKAVVTSWMESPGHRANILASRTSIGVGCFYYEGVLYWVQLFGNNSISSDCSQPSDITQSWEIDLPLGKVYDQYSGEQVDFRFRIEPSALSLEEGEVSAADLYGSGNVDMTYFAREIKFDRGSVGWRAADPEAVSADSSGNIKGLSPGKTRLIAGSLYDRASVPLTVFRRIAGSNRYETAIEAAEQLKLSMGVSAFENIVIASGKDYADALAGAYLAKVKNAPILLVNDQTVSRVSSYTSANLAAGGTVYILGGTGAVPESMESALQGLRTERLAGSNRYLTNLEILEASGVTDEEILVCSGRAFPDALSASAVGKPILLTNASLLPEQEEYLATVNTSKYWLIGGPAAVTQSVEDSLAAKGTEVSRLAGANRYSTSTAVAKQFFDGSAENTVLSYADNFPDGLAGGPVAMSLGAPLILVKHGSTREAGNYLSGSGITDAYVMGGKSLIMNDDVGRSLWGY